MMDNLGTYWVFELIDTWLGLGLRVWGQGLTINTDHSPEWASLSDEPGHGQGAQRREEQQDRERP